MQALYLLNDAFVRCQSLALAEQLLKQVGSDDAGALDRAYRLTVGRPATAAEIERVERYLTSYESTFRQVLAATTRRTQAAASEASLAFAVTDSSGTGAPKKPAPPQNPDEVEQIESPVKEEVIAAADTRTATWASFCQGSWEPNSDIYADFNVMFLNFVIQVSDPEVRRMSYARPAAPAMASGFSRR